MVKLRKHVSNSNRAESDDEFIDDTSYMDDDNNADDDDDDDGANGKDESSNKPRKRQRRASSPQPKADLAAPSIKETTKRAPRIPVLYQSDQHNFFTAAWWKEITKKEEFWVDFQKKVPPAVITRRFQVRIVHSAQPSRPKVNDKAGKSERPYSAAGVIPRMCCNTCAAEANESGLCIACLAKEDDIATPAEQEESPEHPVLSTAINVDVPPEPNLSWKVLYNKHHTKEEDDINVVEDTTTTTTHKSETVDSPASRITLKFSKHQVSKSTSATPASVINIKQEPYIKSDNNQEIPAIIASNVTVKLESDEKPMIKIEDLDSSSLCIVYYGHQRHVVREQDVIVRKLGGLKVAVAQIHGHTVQVDPSRIERMQDLEVEVKSEQHYEESKDPVVIDLEAMESSHSVWDR